MADDRPAWLRPFSLVRGEISSAPLDMPARMEALYAALKAAGWTVAVRSIGTDFEGPGGVPIARDQVVELYLHRTDRPYTANDAAEALATALRTISVNYSAVRAWLGELAREVVAPTARDVRGVVSLGVPLVAAGLLAGALLLRR